LKKKEEVVVSVPKDIVRSRVANGEKVRDIAGELGVTKTVIQRAARGVARVKKTERVKTKAPPRKSWKVRDYEHLSHYVRDYTTSEEGWAKTAYKMGRDVGACQSAFKRMKKMLRNDPFASAADECGASEVTLKFGRAGGWSGAEMTRLAQAIKIAPGDWQKISDIVGTKTVAQCIKRARKSGGRGPWTVEEDTKLRDQWPVHGENWAKYTIEGRDGPSVRQRFYTLGDVV
jgi:hypothetical protein